MLALEFLVKNKSVIMPQPPYSPDLGPAYFLLFPQLKTSMKGKLFATIEEIKEKSKQELLAIPKSSFQKCFEDKCIISEGGYFEGDKIVIDKQIFKNLFKIDNNGYFFITSRMYADG